MYVVHLNKHDNIRDIIFRKEQNSKIQSAN